MLIIEVSWMSKSGYSDEELLEYIDKHYDEIECELNGEVYKEPKKRDHNYCMDCKLRKTIDYERSTFFFDFSFFPTFDFFKNMLLCALDSVC